MKNSKLFLGTIMKCTECNTIPHLIIEGLGTIDTIGHIETKDEVYKEKAVLVRTKNGLYIDVERLSILDIIYLYFENKKGVSSDEPYMFKGSHGDFEGELFVDSDSIKPYVAEEKKDSKSLIMLRKELRRR